MNTKIYDKLAKLRKNQEIKIWHKDWEGALLPNGKPIGPRHTLFHMATIGGKYAQTKRGKEFKGKEFKQLTGIDYWIFTRTK